LIDADKKDYGEMWRESYEDDDFVANVDKMWSQVEPLYKELHTYVRRKLQNMYSKDMDKDSKLIPAHLLGNMWVSFMAGRELKSEICNISSVIRHKAGSISTRESSHSRTEA
jgi:hypothetical protein